jgi:hypothetical protein
MVEPYGGAVHLVSVHSCQTCPHAHVHTLLQKPHLLLDHLLRSGAVPTLQALLSGGDELDGALLQHTGGLTSVIHLDHTTRRRLHSKYGDYSLAPTIVTMQSYLRPFVITSSQYSS